MISEKNVDIGRQQPPNYLVLALHRNSRWNRLIDNALRIQLYGEKSEVH